MPGAGSPKTLSSPPPATLDVGFYIGLRLGGGSRTVDRVGRSFVFTPSLRDQPRHDGSKVPSTAGRTPADHRTPEKQIHRPAELVTFGWEICCESSGNGHIIWNPTRGWAVRRARSWVTEDLVLTASGHPRRWTFDIWLRLGGGHHLEPRQQIFPIRPQPSESP